MLTGSPAFHMRATLALAAPIALSLLAEMAMGLISTVMLGELGAQVLAAGGLATNIFFTCLIVLQGVLSGVGVLVAASIGGGRPGEVPVIYWSGVGLAALLGMPLFWLLSTPQGALHAMGQSGALAADITLYLRILRWGVPGGLVGVGMMRQFLPAVGLQRVLLWVMPGGMALHAAMNVLLIRGAFGWHGWGLAGSAAATVVTLSSLAVCMLALLHTRRRFRLHVMPRRPNWPIVRRLLAIGLPVGATVAVEVGLFMATGVLAGVLGPDVLAAHMIALSVSSVTFMVPLSISKAANVRVAEAMGAGNRPAARRAGFCAIGLSIAFMAFAALMLRAVPGFFVAAYLGAPDAANAATASLAPRLLRVAGMFQMADGTQVAAAGALRGLQDTRVPMFLAAFGYCGVGLGAGWYFAFPQGLGAVGLWWGLCAGLACVAVCLTARFAARSAVRPA